MRNILFVKKPIVINPELAVRLGLNEAIVLQQLNYWITQTSSGRDFENKRWVYNSYSEWSEQIPFLSERTIQRVLLKLEKLGIVKSEMLNKHRGDRTKFYTINQDSELLSFDKNESCQSGSIITPERHDHHAKLALSSSQDGTLSTENTTKTSSKNTSLLADKSAVPKKRKNRTSMPEGFQPTEQHKKLAESLGVSLPEVFPQFVDYHAAKGSKFIDWHAALRTWIRNDVKFRAGNKNKKQSYFREGTKDKNYWEGINDDGTF